MAHVTRSEGRSGGVCLLEDGSGLVGVEGRPLEVVGTFWIERTFCIRFLIIIFFEMFEPGELKISIIPSNLEFHFLVDLAWWGLNSALTQALTLQGVTGRSYSKIRHGL